MAQDGEIITFYSYKGGTGRTMALVNVACLLAQSQSESQKVLMIDWDLEAPGLHRFFRNRIKDKKSSKLLNDDVIAQQPGLIDLFHELEYETRKYDAENEQSEEKAYAFMSKINLNSYILETTVPSLYLMKAGLFDKKYSERINKFSWEELFARSPSLIQALVDCLTEKYRYVLIDSRTGFTDTSGICTMLMPERMVVVFTPNRQSLTGILDLIRDAIDYRLSSNDIRPLSIFPLVSRIEMSESNLYHIWRYGDSGSQLIGYQQQLETLYSEIYGFAPESISLEQYFDEVLIQHVPKYGYGEEIAVLTESATGRLSLARSFENFTTHLTSLNGPWETIQENTLSQSNKVREISEDPSIVVIGYTIEQHEQKLKEETVVLRQDLEKLHQSETIILILEKQILEKELSEKENQLKNIDISYEKRIKFFESTISELRAFSGEVDGKNLADAEAALQKGDVSKADDLFKQIVEAAKDPVERAAKASFERGKIAEANIDYQNAYLRYERAVSLAPNNPQYLEFVGSMAGIVARHQKEIEWKEKALAIYLKQKGATSPDVARLRNNLGNAWQSLGQYEKAIEYYENAYGVFKKVLGDGHPSSKIVKNNLDSLKK